MTKKLTDAHTTLVAKSCELRLRKRIVEKKI